MKLFVKLFSRVVLLRQKKNTHTVQCSFKLKAFFQHYCSKINESTIFAVKICTKCSSFICCCSTQFWYENPEKSYCWWVFFPSFSLKNILKQYCYQIFNVALEAYCCNWCSQRKNIHFTSFVKKYILIFMDKYCHWPAFCSNFCKKKLTFYWKCSNLLYFQIEKRKILILYFNFLHIRNELFYKMRN